MKKNAWIFGSRKGEYFDDNSKYLFLYIARNHPEIQIYWITKNEQVYSFLEKRKLPVLMYRGEDTKEIIQNAQYAFVNISIADIGNKDLFKNVKVVQLWHGTPMKKNNLDTYNEDYYIVSIASSEFLKNQYLGSPEKFDFKLTGYPRNDILLNKELPFTIPQETINLLNHKNVIIFLPTYNEKKDLSKESTDKRGAIYNIWENFDFISFEKFLKKTNSIFIFKPHALQSIGNDLILKKMKKSDYFLILEQSFKVDIYEYLKYSDILLTDYSSILFDFLLLQKPIIFTCFDLNSYNNKRGLRFDYNKITPGEKVFNWEQVLEELTKLLIKKEDSYKIQRLEINNMFNYFKDSNSCKRIVKILKNPKC